MEEQRTQLEAIGELARLLSELGDGTPLPPREHLAKLLDAIHPSDLADLLSATPEDHRLAVFEAIPDDEDAAEVLSLLDEDALEDLLEELSVERKADLLKELPHDDVADVLGELPPTEQDQVLAEMDDEEAAEIRELVKYDPDSAGGLMNDEFVALREGQSVRTALMEVKTSDTWEDVTEVFVVDDAGRLTGVIDLDELLRAKLPQTLSEVMEAKPVFARVDEDGEEAAQRAAHYRLAMMPVVDPEDVLVGVIAYDDVMEALEEEASEDMYRLAGTLEQNPSRENLFDRLMSRFPLLLVTIVGTYVVAELIEVMLAAWHPNAQDVPDVLRFIPMLAALAGNAGIQSSTIMIRGFATGDIQAGDFRLMLGRETSLGVLTGLAAALVEFVFLLVGGAERDTQLVVPTAQAVSVVIATFFGTAIPFLCLRARFKFGTRELRIDPALAAGPFITTLNDIASTVIALALASMFWT